MLPAKARLHLDKASGHAAILSAVRTPLDISVVYIASNATSIFQPMDQEEVSMSCLNGVWCKLLPEFMHNFTGYEPVKDTAEDISRLAQEAGLDKATGEDVTEMLDNHGEQLSNEVVEELAEELSQQEEEKKEKDEEPLLKYMKT